ncbi:MAG: GDP-L-fucose synthase [Phycisphaerales bacterium]|nr:GDP-L-fucose synthase [Phycisphaerales bacterium]
MAAPEHQRILITGGGGFLGRAVRARLVAAGVPAAHILAPRRAEFDLTRQSDAERLITGAFTANGTTAGPTTIIHLAAEVGGIGANRKHPGRFIFANMAMGMNVLEAARASGLAERGGLFVHAGSICSYPKHTPVPFNERELWNGYPEETNAPYGIAKKAVGEMLGAYQREYGLRGVYLLPVNLYGPHDNFDLESSHVVPALIRKCVEAKRRGDSELVCWGTGAASREFLYVEDAAEAVTRAALAPSKSAEDASPINIGSGQEITIRGLVELVVELTGFEGGVLWDATRPDGQPRRSLDTSRATELLGWGATTALREGLGRTIRWYEREALGTGH